MNLLSLEQAAADSVANADPAVCVGAVPSPASSRSTEHNGPRSDLLREELPRFESHWGHYLDA